MARGSVSPIKEAHGYGVYQESQPMLADKSANSPEMVRFNSALRQAMQVSKADLKRLLAQDKITPLVPQKRGRKPKAQI